MVAGALSSIKDVIFEFPRPGYIRGAHNFGYSEKEPMLYIPLHRDLIVSGTCGAQSGIIPISPIRLQGTDRIVYDNDGLIFENDKSILIHLNDLPSSTTSRSFLFAARTLHHGSLSKPIFLFSYGAREHGKSFGLYIGTPQVDKKNNVIALHIFRFCDEKYDPTDGTSDLCIDVEIDDTWHIYGITYDKNESLCVYRDDKLVYNQKVPIDTMQSRYLSIGGFVPYSNPVDFFDIKKTNSRKDLYKNEDIFSLSTLYGFVGRIREFYIFDRCLDEKEYNDIRKTIQLNLNI